MGDAFFNVILDDLGRVWARDVSDIYPRYIRGALGELPGWSEKRKREEVKQKKRKEEEREEVEKRRRKEKKKKRRREKEEKMRRKEQKKKKRRRVKKEGEGRRTTEHPSANKQLYIQTPDRPPLRLLC